MSVQFFDNPETEDIEMPNDQRTPSFQEEIMNKIERLIKHITSIHQRFERPHGNITTEMLHDVHRSIESQLQANLDIATIQDDIYALVRVICDEIEKIFSPSEQSSNLRNVIQELRTTGDLRAENILHRLTSVSHFQKQYCYCLRNEKPSHGGACFECENGRLRRQLEQEIRWRSKILTIQNMGTDAAFDKLIEQDGFSRVREKCKYKLDTTARSIDTLKERFEDLSEKQKLRFLASGLNLTQ